MKREHVIGAIARLPAVDLHDGQDRLREADTVGTLSSAIFVSTVRQGAGLLRRPGHQLWRAWRFLLAFIVIGRGPFLRATNRVESNDRIMHQPAGLDFCLIGGPQKMRDSQCVPIPNKSEIDRRS